MKYIYFFITLIILFGAWSVGHESGYNSGLREGYSMAESEFSPKESDYLSCIDELRTENSDLINGMEFIDSSLFQFTIGYPTYDEMFDSMNEIKSTVDSSYTPGIIHDSCK